MTLRHCRWMRKYRQVICIQASTIAILQALIIFRKGSEHRLTGKSPSYVGSIVKKGRKEIPRVSEGDDTCKAQLLEALCHSQTRAREAEKAAKQACDAKEDIIDLLFRQASQLFAYKQWFQLLQLEVLLNRKCRKLNRNRQKYTDGERPKRCRPVNDMSRYAVSALGLNLVGAGLLLGWTVGWMVQ